MREHVEEHLEEIRNIDVEELKRGHEVFECVHCKFRSIDNDKVRKHLESHALQPNIEAKRMTKTKKEKEEIIKAGSFRDLYNDYGEPLYDTEDSESSEDSDFEA